MSTETKEAPTSEKKENGYQPDTLTGRKTIELIDTITKFVNFSTFAMKDTGKSKLNLEIKELEKEAIEAASKHFDARLWIPEGNTNHFWCRIYGDNYEVYLNTVDYEAKTTYIVKTVEQVTV